MASPSGSPSTASAVATGEVPPGYAVDDCAALLLCGTEVSRCVSSRPGARVVRVEADGEGATTERPMTVEVLPGAVAPETAPGAASAGEPPRRL